MNFLGDRGIRFELRAQMHRAVTNVTRLILHAAAEDFLVDAARRDELALAEQRQHEAFAQQMQSAGLGGKTWRIENAFERKLAH